MGKPTRSKKTHREVYLCIMYRPYGMFPTYVSPLCLACSHNVLHVMGGTHLSTQEFSHHLAAMTLGKLGGVFRLTTRSSAWQTTRSFTPSAHFGIPIYQHPIWEASSSTSARSLTFDFGCKKYMFHFFVLGSFISERQIHASFEQVDPSLRSKRLRRSLKK